MNLHNIKKIAYRDLFELNKKILFSIPGFVIVTSVFILPSIVKPNESELQIVEKLMSLYLKNHLDLSKPDIIKMILLDLKFPLLILLPAFLSPLFFTIDSLLGEKENRTIENLFVLPVSDQEILLGKMSLGLFWGITSSWMLYIFYILVFLLISTPVAHYLMSVKWLSISLFIVPTSAFLVNTIGIICSILFRKIKTAQMSGMIIIMPFFIIFTLIDYGIIIISPMILIFATLIMFFLSFLLFKLALNLFQREKILLRY